MKVDYTEFSYGYAFTENLIRSSSKSPTGAPVFPNLLQEGQSGFDVRINFPGIPLFFQYKLPDVMKRTTASEIAKWACRGLTIPFFRISMMRSDISRQHELLIKLEERYPGCVFYAAACLENIDEFDRAYDTASVAEQSVFFSPKEIGTLPDNKAHTIAYQRGLANAYFCSEPRELRSLAYERLTEVLRAHFQEVRFNRIEDSVREIRENVLELASPTMRQTQVTIEQRIRASRVQIPRTVERSAEEERVAIDILVTREIARVDLGVEVLISQPRQ